MTEVIIHRDCAGNPCGVLTDGCYGARVGMVDKPVYTWVPYKSRRYRVTLGGRWMLRIYPTSGRMAHVLIPHAHLPSDC